MLRLKQRLVKWYEGKYVPPHNPPGCLVELIGHMQRPWLALAIDSTLKFLRAHWQWAIGTALAVAALVIEAQK